MPLKAKVSDRRRYRNCAFTVNNPPDDRIASILANLDYSYVVIAKEVAASGTPHLQGYIEFTRQYDHSRLQPYLGHFEPRKKKATPKNASDYCKKGEQSKAEWNEKKIRGPNYGKNADFMEEGTLSSAGERTDLVDLRDEIMSGTATPRQIRYVSPDMYHQYGRTIEALHNDYLRTQFRTEMTRLTWYHGPTGAGKSHCAYQDFHPDTHYDYPYDSNDWWDDYEGQPTVILNDFRGTIPYDTLLRLADKWPCSVRRRGQPPRPFVSNHIIVTSSKTPKQVYSNRLIEDDIAQLLRRCELVEVGQEGATITPPDHL